MLRFTLREMHRYYSNKITIMILLGTALICTLSGPFGTLENLFLWQRLLYWATTVVICAGLARLSFIIVELISQRFEMHEVVYLFLANLLAASLISVFCLAVIRLIWGGGDNLPQPLFLFLVAFVIGIFISFVIHFINAEKLKNPNLAHADLENNAFYERLPKALGRDVISLSSQDHYLNVTTTKGSELILMRLSDAIQALPKEMGVQIHRSHWVAKSAIKSLSKTGGKWELILQNDEILPVSRNYRENVKALKL